MRQAPAGPQWSATIALLVINAVVYLVQFHVLPPRISIRFEEYFALSLDGLKAGRLWQLLTYQFMHGSFWHIFANSWVIYVFGRFLETLLGQRRMLTLYFLSGVMGGVLQMLGAWVWPDHLGSAVVGASAGAFGLVAAFAVLFPDRRLFLLLFFFIPIAMRARTMLWVFVAISLVGVWWPYGNIGHAAHLGGILGGFLFARRFGRGRRLPPFAELGEKTVLKVTPAPD